MSPPPVTEPARPVVVRSLPEDAVGWSECPHPEPEWSGLPTWQREQIGLVRPRSPGPRSEPRRGSRGQPMAMGPSAYHQGRARARQAVYELRRNLMGGRLGTTGGW
jgi:hypothetical protein